jgi:hypothetical protein
MNNIKTYTEGLFIIIRLIYLEQILSYHQYTSSNYKNKKNP